MIRIKICGVTRPGDLEYLEGVDAIGLNFHAPSLRCIDTLTASAILEEWTGTSVGVIVDEDPTAIETLQVNAIQTYSRTTVSRKALIPAYRVESAADLASILVDASTPPRPAAILIDGARPGSGQPMNWHLLAGFRPAVPWILAGGLTPENVAKAIEICRPDGVDVASGVESSAGVKDRVKVKDFVQAARAAFTVL